jgi:hypothetical protein
VRAVDLLGATVYDNAGTKVGVVHDVYLQRGGRVVAGSGQPAYRIAALECGPGGFAHRLGYGHRDLAGPWPLNEILAKMVRRSRLVRWEQIAAIAGRRIDLSLSRDAVAALGGDDD